MGTADRDEDDAQEIDDLDPASGPRAKKPPSEAVQLFVAELRGRVRGLEGDALELECDRFLDRMIERQVAVAPERLKARVRETLRELLATDPAFVALRGDLRAAARRAT